MADSKYGNLVQKLNFVKGHGGANAKELVFLGAKDLSGFDFNFIVGVYGEEGDWAPGAGAHNHPFDELIMFFGYDPTDMNYLGAELDLHMGVEWEKHEVKIPTVALAPKGFPHIPLITTKVFKDFGHFHLALSGTYKGKPVEKKGETDGTKYNHMMKAMIAKEGPGGANARQIFEMTGEDLGGMNINYVMGLYNEAGEYYPGKGAQIHPYDEVLVFFGHNTDDMSYLGAEITVSIGEEKEQHTFDVPTAIAIPRGTPHMPIVCNKVDQPYRMMQIGLSPKYETEWV